MRRKSSCLIIGLSGLLLLNGCHTPPKHSVEAPDDQVALASDRAVDRLARTHAHYAAGLLHDMNNESDKALEEFFKAAQSDPHDEVLVLEVTRRLSQNKQFEKALELLLPAAAQPDATAAVISRLGMVYSQLGQTDKAIEANKLAIKKQPRAYPGYQNLFLSYLQLKQPDKALALLDEAAKVPDVGGDFLVGISELYVNYSLQFPTQREAIKPKALALLNQAEKMTLRSAGLRFRLAEGLNSLGDTERAAKVYMSLLKNPGDLSILRDTARARLAEIYLKANDSKGAVEQLESVLKDDPANALAYYLLGEVALNDQRSKDAADYLRKALLFGDQFDRQRLEQIHYDLARAQIIVDDPASAVDTLENARKKFGPNFVSEYLLGVAENARKNYAAAAKHFSEAEVNARANEPERLDHTFYFQAGVAAERTGDRTQAESYFQKCLTMSPEFSPALNYLGYMWAEKGENLDKAKEFIERALKAEPDSAAYLDSLGWVLFKQNKPAEALDYILKAVKLIEEPDATVYDHLGDIYAALNQMDKAREAWTKSLGVEKSDTVQKKLDAPAKK